MKTNTFESFLCRFPEIYSFESLPLLQLTNTIVLYICFSILIEGYHSRMDFQLITSWYSNLMVAEYNIKLHKDFRHYLF